MPRERETLYIGIGGSVVAIDGTTGQEIWRTKLKSASFITVTQVGKRVLAGAGGELFCLDPATGSLLWNNKLKGLGHGVIAFAGSGDSVMAAAAAAAQAAQAAAAG